MPSVGRKLGELCPDAGKVIRRLRQAGFTGYLCGGCVRDLLLDLRPKDFDLATDATPRQMKRLFRNSRIIGRRFRLVQVTFPDKVLEVSTFRAATDVPADSADLLIQQDNTFGTPEEDARRRDFTINGLFYDLEFSRVIDYVGGLRDLKRRIVETIGDPWVRFREDPVRMLRAIKFASRLGFRIADDAYQAILDCRDELRRAASARVLEEILRLMNLGGAHDAMRLLYRTGILAILVPELAEALDDASHRGDAAVCAPYWGMLRRLDASVRAGNPAGNARMLSLLLWPLFREEIESGAAQSAGEDPHDALRPIALRLRMARRDAFMVRQVMLVQRRFSASARGRRRKPTVQQLMTRDYFEDAYFFFRARAEETGGQEEDLTAWDQRLEG